MEELKVWIYFWGSVVIIFLILWVITNYKQFKKK